MLFQVGDEDVINGLEAAESTDNFPQKIENELRPNGDIAERRKRLRYVNKQ